MTGLTFLSRLTQIAPPYTRFVFLGAGLRLGLPSHPASRRRSCLRLGVSTTSSSRGLSPPSDRPCRAYSRAAPAAPLARRQRRALPLSGPPVARRATPTGHSDQDRSHVAQSAAATSRQPRSRLSRSRPPRQGRPTGVAEGDRLSPPLDPATT